MTDDELLQRLDSIQRTVDALAACLEEIMPAARKASAMLNGSRLEKARAIVSGFKG